VRRLLIIAAGLSAVLHSAPVLADEGGYDEVQAGAETTVDAVRVIVVKAGGSYEVQGVSGGDSADSQGCHWSLVFAPNLEDAPLGTSPGPKPDPDARFALLLCDGTIVRAIWVAPADVVDLDAAARVEALRYVEDVLTPAVSIGVNPAGTGLAGLRSWFWIDGFTGSVTAPPISAFGLTIEVRMSSGSVAWDFGDDETMDGDLGRAYPEESTVQHAHRRAGRFTITAVIDLVPEYRVDGGPWLTLPDLAVTATTSHQVEERQPVITDV
jgi:hypothetical protein